MQTIKYCKRLDQLRYYDISRQLFRCSTSIGANANEAQAAQSKRDFLAKIYVSAKEAREARYFLNLILASNIVPEENKQTGQLLKDIEELIKILTKITKTTSNSISK